VGAMQDSHTGPAVDRLISSLAQKPYSVWRRASRGRIRVFTSTGTKFPDTGEDCTGGGKSVSDEASGWAIRRVGAVNLKPIAQRIGSFFACMRESFRSAGSICGQAGGTVCSKYR